MATITDRVAGYVTLIKATGTITLDDLVAVLQKFYTANPTKFVVWDVTKASATQLATEDINRIARFVSQHDHTRVGGKTAIVAAHDLEFGIGRMFDTFAELYGIQFDVATFRDLTEAAKWLGVASLPSVD